MKRNIMIMILCLFSIIIYGDIIKLVADNWMPYNGEPGSANPGYGIEIVTKIFEDAGHKIEYKTMPWNRSIKLTREGKYDAIIGAFEDDAPDFIYPKEEFGNSIHGFYIQSQSSWKYSGKESLNNMKMGLIKDYAYGELIDGYAKANPNNIDYAYGDYPLESNLKKLAGGRIDLVFEDINVGALKIKELKLESKVKLGGKLPENHKVYVAFSPKNPKSKEYAQIFSDGIIKMKENGELDKILKKYNLSYWK